MEFITLDDVRDGILQVEQSDIDEANRYVTNVGVRLGVAEDMFVAPLKYPTYRLAVVYACYLCALRQVGTDGSVIFDGKENADIYAQKLAHYRNEVHTIEPRLTSSDFTDQKIRGGRTIEMWRG